MITFSIVITTYNRLSDLEITLKSLEHLFQRDDVELLVLDDDSIDGTQQFLKNNYHSHRLFFNTKRKGLIYNRNVLNNHAKGDYIISVDDDAHFLTKNILEEIQKCFNEYSDCAVQSLRIFWGANQPKTFRTKDKIKLTKGFVGCGHVWRKTAWNTITNYPAWFVFYGEEEFASYQLFKSNWKIYYNPNVLVHHRVDVKLRKEQKDYQIRLRRSLRSGWYLYVLFYPLNQIPKRFLYTVYTQIKRKTFKGDIKASIAIIQALFDVLLNFPRLIKISNRLTQVEFKAYQKLPETKLYWKPEQD